MFLEGRTTTTTTAAAGEKMGKMDAISDEKEPPFGMYVV
jgi:hypothetical protein